jgi:hypothetical protein
VYFQRKTYEDKALKRLDLTIKPCYVKSVLYCFAKFLQMDMSIPMNNKKTSHYWVFYYFRYCCEQGGA